jgi:hypothetical protein
VTKSREVNEPVWSKFWVTNDPNRDMSLATDNIGNVWLATNFQKHIDLDQTGYEAQGDEAVMLLKLSP